MGELLERSPINQFEAEVVKAIAVAQLEDVGSKAQPQACSLLGRARLEAKANDLAVEPRGSLWIWHRQSDV
jgi:hypothetical protein